MRTSIFLFSSRDYSLGGDIIIKVAASDTMQESIPKLFPCSISSSSVLVHTCIHTTVTPIVSIPLR